MNNRFGIKTNDFWQMAALMLPMVAMLCLAECSPKTQGQSALLKAMLVDAPPSGDVVVSYAKYDTGGNTSMANDAGLQYKWSGQSPYKHGGFGYFNTQNQEIPYIKRSRDLGQTFRYTGSTSKTVESVTMRLGFGDNAVRPGTYGHHISLQFFEVTGTPVINDNGSDSTMSAFHGWPNDRLSKHIPFYKDDYITGETYHSLAVLSGATFPSKADFGFANDHMDVSPDDAKLKGRYLQFVLPPGNGVTLEPGKEYAFLVMIDSLGEHRGFTLCSKYVDEYPDGHGIRRGGDGKFPPTPCDPSKDFNDPANKAALASTLFPDDMTKRSAIPPGTNGYPDVDTQRDFVFFIQAK